MNKAVEFMLGRFDQWELIVHPVRPYNSIIFVDGPVELREQFNEALQHATLACHGYEVRAWDQRESYETLRRNFAKET